MNRTRGQPGGRQRERGVAALAVVLVLFFLVSLMAAYTSRNLIFEQKTSANQYRGSMAFEAAEAGVEWTLAMLNGGLVDDSCGSTAPTKSFAQRYLAIAADGVVTHPVRNGNWPTCVFDGNGWSECRCPDATAVDPTPPSGTGPFPAFRVWLAPPGPAATPATPENQLIARPGMVWLQSTGCTRLPTAVGDGCLDYNPQAQIGDGVARLFGVLALRSGLAVPPAAAVTARLGVEPAASPALPLRVVNEHAASGGLTVNAGGALDPGRFLARSVPGTPGELSLVGNDSRLAALSVTAPATSPPAPAALSAGERMFVATFGMNRQTYRQQPGLRVCGSSTTPCSAAEINTLLADNPDRIIWVDGDLTLDASVGSSASPVLLIVDGETLTLDPGVQIQGFAYLRGDPATEIATVALNDGASAVLGALVAEGRLRTTASSAASELLVTYDADTLNRLRTRYGSWVRVGGSWRDFRAPP